MKKRLKRMGTGILFAAVVLLLSACGKEPADNDGKEQAESSGEISVETEYSWLPEYKGMGGGEWTSFQEIRFAGDFLYYEQVFFDVVNQTNVPVLKQYSLAEGRVLKERDVFQDREDGSGRRIAKYAVQADGTLYTVEEESSRTGNSEKVLLCAYDADWNLKWEQDITSVMDQAGRNIWVEYMALDGEGRICLASEEVLFLFDGEGVSRGNIPLEQMWIVGLGTDRDGGMYVCYQDQQSLEGLSYCLAEVDFEKQELGAVYKDFPEPSAGSVFVAGENTDFLVIGTGGLYGYNLAAQSAGQLLAWEDFGMASGVAAVGTVGNGNLNVFWRDSSMQENYLVSMERVEAALLPEKTRIVLGCLGNDHGLQAEVAAFNRQSDSYSVSILDYKQKDGTEIAAQEAVDALSVALATGIDCPDILALDQMEAYGMDLEAIAGNGAFADLEPFLEGSSLVSKEDFLENALDSRRYHGLLVGIPCDISLRTVAGNASELGEEPGWTLEEMMAYADAHPDRKLFDGKVREGILEDCLASGMDSFVDRESGQCFFDSEEFGRLLAFAGTFPEEYDPQADDRSTGAKIQAGEVLLSTAMIDSFYKVQEYQVMFDGSVVYIGYPGPEGTGCIADCTGALGISAQSPNQQAAWEFVEYHLERQADNRFRSGFSTRKSSLDLQMEEAATVSYYLDDQGNPLLDAEGRPVPKSLGGVGWSFEELIMFRTAAEEEVRCVREMIENARPARALDERILDIIREEAEPFFQGQKSVEDVTGIIQSRVQLYLEGR